MPRPSVPLITRDAAINAALKIIDEEGIASFGMRRLAVELNVNAASLYHHFDNKDALLVEVLRIALHDLTIPSELPESWIDAIVELSCDFRGVLLRHPNLLPLVVHRVDRNFQPSGYNYYVRLLTREKFQPHLIMPLIDSVLALTIGAVTIEISAGEAQPYSPRLQGLYPELNEAITANVLDRDTQLRLSLRALLKGWEEEAVRSKLASSPRTNGARRRATTRTRRSSGSTG